MQAGLDGNP